MGPNACLRHRLVSCSQTRGCCHQLSTGQVLCFLENETKVRAAAAGARLTLQLFPMTDRFTLTLSPRLQPSPTMHALPTALLLPSTVDGGRMLSYLDGSIPVKWRATSEAATCGAQVDSRRHCELRVSS